MSTGGAAADLAADDELSGQEEPAGLQAPDEPARGRGRKRRWWTVAGALLVYVVLALVLFRAAWAAPGVRNVGNAYDPLFNMWVLNWTPWALSHGQNPLFTDHLNFPHGVNLMWNTFLPLHGLLLWPVTAFGGPRLSYNVLVTLNVAFSAWCAFLALRSFVTSTPAAFAGGLLYGFSPYMLAQSLDHPSLTAAYIPPLLLLVLREILVRQERSPLRMGAVLGVLTAAQLFIAEEMLAAQAVTCAMGLFFLVALDRRAVRARAPHVLRALATATGVFLLLTSWALHFQFFGPQRITGGSVQAPNVFVTDLANLVVPTGVQQVAPSWAVSMSDGWTGNLSEWDGYLGVPLLAVLMYAVVRFRHRPEVRFAGLLALGMAILSLGPNLHVNGSDTGVPLPWRVIEKVPLLGHVLPARLMLFVFLMAAVLLAVTVDHVVATKAWRRRSAACIAGAVAAAGMVVTLLPDLSYPSSRVAVPRFFTDGSARIVPEDSVALVAPFQLLYPADPMLWQAEAGMRFRMPQGYFFAPDDRGGPRYGAPLSALTAKMLDIQAGQPRPELTPELRAAIAADLAAREVQTVLVGPTQHEAEMVRFFREVLGPPSQRIGGVYVWQRVHRLLR